MKMRSLSLLLISLGLSLTCSSRVELNNAEVADLKHVQEFVNGPMGWYSSMFRGVFYAGSDSTHDYIAIKYEQRSVKLFKTRRGELSVDHRMVATDHAAKWVDITRMFPAPR